MWLPFLKVMIGLLYTKNYTLCRLCGCAGGAVFVGAQRRAQCGGHNIEGSRIMIGALHTA